MRLYLCYSPREKEQRNAKPASAGELYGAENTLK